MMMRIAVVVLAVLASGGFAGCGDDDKGTNGNGKADSIPSELVATWTFDSAIINGTSVPISARITINGDGSFVYEELDGEGKVVWTETGTFSVSGNTFTITTELPIPESGTWAVSGNLLTLSYSTEDLEIVITATK